MWAYMVDYVFELVLLCLGTCLGDRRWDRLQLPHNSKLFDLWLKWCKRRGHVIFVGFVCLFPLFCLHLHLCQYKFLFELLLWFNSFLLFLVCFLFLLILIFCNLLISSNCVSLHIFLRVFVDIFCCFTFESFILNC